MLRGLPASFDATFEPVAPRGAGIRSGSAPLREMPGARRRGLTVQSHVSSREYRQPMGRCSKEDMQSCCAKLSSLLPVPLLSVS
jgi:hypothetical protein